MAYSALPAKIASDTLTLGNYNAIKGNFEAGVPDIFTTKGDLASATAANAATRTGVGADASTLVADSGAAGGIAWQIQPACRVYNDANIDPATSTWVTLTFNQELYDTNSMHSTVSNTGRITAPTSGGGYYIIGANVEFDTTEAGAGQHWIGLRLRVNASAVIAQEMRSNDAGGVEYDGCITICTLYHLAVADYVEVQCWTTVDVNVLTSTAYSPHFWAMWQRRS